MPNPEPTYDEIMSKDKEIEEKEEDSKAKGEE